MCREIDKSQAPNSKQYLNSKCLNIKTLENLGLFVIWSLIIGIFPKGGLLSLFGPKQEIGSTQDFLKFSEIKDDTAILKDGNLRQVLLCSSINFSLKSEQEQNAIVYAYQNFLNSLSFPIQILMQSKKLDLTKYLEKLQIKSTKQTNELLRLQTVDYIDFVKRLVSLANIMDKRFYVVVPFIIPVKIGTGLPGQNSNRIVLSNDEFRQYLIELKQRVSVIQSGLGSIGIRCALLNTQQIIELLYEVYNPEEASKQKLTAAENLEGEIVESEIFAPKTAEETNEPGNLPTT